MKKYSILRFVMSVTLIIVMMFGGTFSAMAATGDTHEHSYRSTEMVERVIRTESVVTLFTYEKDGRTYEVRRVTEWCLFYRECYCGFRGCYREGGRTRDIDVLLP